ncbi:hypothetical protein [Noviherbaspirillum malthae]|jgi:hypothetical protein|uniref:hypothetical protein n=1 Tax=Noviherbaspirillum malthae TaxID=1260987 RepID=UPI00188F17A0|nr:hypothetical protein [Noviherbaspirillum malthae]
METVLPSIILATSTAIAALSSDSSDEIEKIYWDCEFMAVQGMITPDQAAACSEIYERLKNEKFLGNYHRFLVWWKQEKEREFATRYKQR